MRGTGVGAVCGNLNPQKPPRTEVSLKTRFGVCWSRTVQGPAGAAPALTPRSRCAGSKRGLARGRTSSLWAGQGVGPGGWCLPGCTPNGSVGRGEELVAKAAPPAKPPPAGVASVTPPSLQGPTGPRCPFHRAPALAHLSHPEEAGPSAGPRSHRAVKSGPWARDCIPTWAPSPEAPTSGLHGPGGSGARPAQRRGLWP